MIFSNLLTIPIFHEQLMKHGIVSVPTIPQIQQLIEAAWADGFEPESAKYFRGKICGTTKRIGASEGYALFRYLRIPAMIVDAYNAQAVYHFILHYFRSRYGLPPVKAAKPLPDVIGNPYMDLSEDIFVTKVYHLPTSGPLEHYVPPKIPADSTPHLTGSPYIEEAVFDVLEYSNRRGMSFPSVTAHPYALPAISSSAAESDEAAPSTSASAPVGVFCPPILFQTSTRSKTIIGVEPMKGHAYSVLMFDPYSPYQADPKEDPVKILNSFRHPPSRLSSLDNIFEILYIDAPRLVTEEEAAQTKDLEQLAVEGSPIITRLF